jgi:hypothetical protein
MVSNVENKKGISIHLNIHLTREFVIIPLSDACRSLSWDKRILREEVSSIESKGSVRGFGGIQGR